MAAEFLAKPTIEGAGQSKRPTPKHIFEGHEGSIRCLVFLDDNVHIVSGSWDGTMRKWDCNTGLLVGEPWRGEGGRVYALAQSPDGKTIVCGRADGNVQLWNTEGKMMEGVWTGHSGRVRSLSWSPSGSHLASGSEDGTILIRKAESGEVEVGPMKTEQSVVRSLAYSPVGDKIASGSYNNTICIWDSKTGELVVGPIKELGQYVTSVTWSSDGTKIYSASDRFARIFDSVSGAEIHRFEHSRSLFSVALSPNHKVLACVGNNGRTQLWDTETHQQLGQPLGNGRKRLQFVLFSPDGRYLAHGGQDNKITLWMVNEIAPGFAVDASTIIEDAVLEETRPDSPESSSSSFLDLDAKNPRARSGDRYKNFFRSSKSSIASASSNSNSSPLYRRFWTFIIPSRHRPLENKSLPSKEMRPKRSPFRRRARSKSPLRVPATTDSIKPTSKGKVQEGEHVPESRMDVLPRTSSIITSAGNQCLANSPPRPDTVKKKTDNGKQREESIADVQSPHPDDPSPLEHDNIQSLAPSGPSCRPLPGNESSIPLYQRAKRAFFSRHSGPRPVTIFAGRPRQFYWTAPRPVLPNAHSADEEKGDTKVHAEQSPLAHPQSDSQSTPHGAHHPQTQAASQHAQDQYDYGCWGNFWHAACCIPHHPRPVVSIPPAAS